MKKETLGMTIAALRKKNGMTQLDLAEKMGVTDKAVSKWERDISCPDVNTLPKLAELFGISMDELMQLKLGENNKDEEMNNIIDLILRAVPLAMGVATVVLSVLKTIDIYSGFSLLGIGLACISISLFRKNGKE